MGRSKALNTVVPLVIYPLDIMFSLGQSDTELRADMKKQGFKWGKDCKFNDGVNGYFMKTKNGGLIRLKDYPTSACDFGMLQHEIFHAVETTLSYLEFKLDDSSCEAYAYLIGYLTEQVYKLLKL